MAASGNPARRGSVRAVDRKLAHDRPVSATPLFAISLAASLAACGARSSPESPPAVDPDERVASFLAEHRGGWRAANVPYADGQVLHDMIVKHGFKSILEIGTSTGHSTIWLAWAARETGGHVTTVEIDRGRYEQAIENVKAVGLMDQVTFHIADAHLLVPKLEGPFDLVFSDADKDWYINYFKDVDPKIRPGGCIAAHNALNGFEGVDRYVAFVRQRTDYETEIVRSSPSGFAISCKKP